MKVGSCWLSLLLFASLLAIIYPSELTAGVRRWLTKGRNKLSFWKKNSVGHQTGDDKNDLAELNRLKQSNGTGALIIGIQSSIEEFDELNYDGRQLIYGTCTCASTSFCSPTTTISTSYDFGIAQTVTSITVSCSSSSACSTICTSLSTICSSSCSIFTSLTAIYYTSYTYSIIVFVATTTYPATTGASTSSSVSVYSSGCDSLSTACTTTTTRLVFAPGAAAAVAIAVGVGAGVCGAQAVQAQQIANNQNQIQGANSETGACDIAPIPINDFSTNFNETGPDDGCDDESIIFDDGNCYLLLRQGPCPERDQWLTVDPVSLRVLKLNLILEKGNQLSN